MVRVEHRSGIAWITFANYERGINVLDRETIDQFGECLNGIRGDLFDGVALRGIVVQSDLPGCFIAGADIEEIRSMTNEKEIDLTVGVVQAKFNDLEGAGVPVVAVINGVCLGGGLELALACHYRIALSDKRVSIGLPETQLGIIPGFGGTQRLPRVIGLTKALTAITLGKNYGAVHAHKLGLVDYVVPDEGIDDAVEKAIKRGIRCTCDRSPFAGKKESFGHSLIIREAHRRSQKQTKGKYPAIPAAIDAVADGLADIHDGFASERRRVASLVLSSESKALTGIFLTKQRAEREFRNVDAQFEQVSVLGSGVMGRGIAYALAYADVPTVLRDISPEALGSARKFIGDRFDREVSGRRLSRVEANRRMNLVTFTLDATVAAHSPVIIESIAVGGHDRLDIKQAAVEEMRSLGSGEQLIASNTSSLSIADIGDGVVGMHFFNPAYKMPLVEVIQGSASDDDVAVIGALALRLRKTPIVVADSPGFLVNRVLGSYLAEAAELLYEGVSIEDIDRALEKFGMPMGPFRLIDEVGLDIAWSVSSNLTEAFGDHMNAPLDFDLLIGEGILGRKSGHGIWMPNGKRVNKRALDFLFGLNAPYGSVAMSDDDIVDRCVLRMVNELSLCVWDRTIIDAGFADLAMVLGTGFAPFHGGPLAYADSCGLNVIVDKLKNFQERYPDAPCGRFTESHLLYGNMRRGDIFRKDLL